MVSSGALLLLAVLATTVSAQTDCASQNDFIGMLDQVIETKINNTLFRDSLDRIRERINGEVFATLNNELERRVRDQIGNVLATEPVIRTMLVTMFPDRVLAVDLPSGQRVSITLSNPSQAVTSDDNLLAYRPRYADYHNSGLAVMFLNMEGIFPCTRSTPEDPQCGLLTSEEDGFLGGRSFIPAADRGNNFRIFNSTEEIKTFGLALQGCPEWIPACVPVFTQVTVFCLLPRQQCA